MCDEHEHGKKNVPVFRSNATLNDTTSTSLLNAVFKQSSQHK